eukprot:Sspe_Gene.114546::Locus_100236_Transcript_1_1_Confidence_1.000_Length_440::g.114546::m.114546
MCVMGYALSMVNTSLVCLGPCNSSYHQVHHKGECRTLTTDECTAREGRSAYLDYDTMLCTDLLLPVVTPPPKTPASSPPSSAIPVAALFLPALACLIIGLVAAAMGKARPPQRRAFDCAFWWLRIISFRQL